VSGRLDRCFANARSRGRKVLIPFITAGDPAPVWTVSLMHALVEGGADIVELGVPFSDPMADGPVIQASSERAVRRGVDLSMILGWVEAFRVDDDETPVVLMGYMNPFERFGYARLAAETSKAGVDGLLLVDCPPEEMTTLQESLDEHGVYCIRLVAPTTTDERLQAIAGSARGFIYYVSFKGITGAGRLDVGALSRPLERVRQASDLPVAVGFGIKDAQSACAVAAHADAVVIGSALVERLAGQESEDRARACALEFMGPIRAALDAPRR